jgi:hypothetical protein
MMPFFISNPDPSNNFDTLLTRLLELVGDREQLVHHTKSQVKKIEDVLRIEKPRKLRHLVASVGLSLEIMGKWFGATGICKLSKGDLAGWDDVSASFEYNAFNTWLRHSMICFEKRVDSEPFLASLFDADESLVFLQSIAQRHDDFANSMGQQLLSNYSKHSSSHDDFFYVQDTQPFSLCLFAAWKQIPFSFPKRMRNPLGNYSKVMDTLHLNNAEAVAAIRNACDYHCQTAISRSGVCPFTASPFNLIPFEIVAINRVREELGSGRISVDHKLLNRVFSSIPSWPTRIKIDIFGEIEEYLRLHFQEINVDCRW